MSRQVNILHLYFWKVFLDTPNLLRIFSFCEFNNYGWIFLLIRNSRQRCLRPATLLKKKLWHRSFPVNFAKFLRTLFSKEHIWKLLLFVLVVFKYIKKWIFQKVIGGLTQFRLNYVFQCRFRRCSKIENKFEFIVQVKIWCLRLVLSVFRSIHQRCSIKKSCSQKCRNIHRKTPVLESLFNKVAGH